MQSARSRFLGRGTALLVPAVVGLGLPGSPALATPGAPAPGLPAVRAPVASVAAGSEAPPPGTGPGAPQPVCTIDDARVAELSGLVAEGAADAQPQRYHAIADGGGSGTVATLDPATCAVTAVRDTGVAVEDVEDLGATPDGALWLADVGDNGARRDTVRLVVLPVSGPPRVHDLVYPDGPRDAEAVLVADDGVPLIVEKAAGAAGVYRPDRPLGGGGTAGLRRVAEIVLPYSAGAGGPLGAGGARTVTGGAVAPPGTDGGRAAVLRTYTDAWLFPLGSNPAGVLTGDALVDALRGAPMPIPLPDEPQGEAVTVDGRGTLHSGTEARGTASAGVRAVPGAVAAATATSAPVVPQPAEAPRHPATPEWLPAVAGAGALGALLLAGIGAMALHGRRR